MSTMKIVSKLRPSVNSSLGGLIVVTAGIAIDKASTNASVEQILYVLGVLFVAYSLTSGGKLITFGEKALELYQGFKDVIAAKDSEAQLLKLAEQEILHGHSKSSE